MPVVKPAENALARLRRFEPARRLYRHLRRTPRLLLRTDARAAKRYLARSPRPRLHLGCGEHVLDGWLNADLAFARPQVMHVDATRALPFADGTFVYIYSAYMIGSLAVEEAAALLRECLRVLAPGGKVRIATIDLAFLLGLYRTHGDSVHGRYVQWAIARRLAPCRHSLCRNMPSSHDSGDGDSGSSRTQGVADGVFLNHHLHAPSARFVYDEPVLKAMLRQAGFSNAARCELNGSEDADLRDLANEERMPDGFLQLECLVIEGTKPAHDAVSTPPS